METHTCSTCGRTWQRRPTKGQRPKYCPACRDTSGNGRVPRKCAVCDVPVMKAAGRGRVVCSPVCRSVLASEGRRPPRKRTFKSPKFASAYYVPCKAGCGEYVADSSYPGGDPRAYCSPGCRDRKRPRATGQARFVAGTCVLCGDSFVVEWQGAARTCSDACLRKYAKDRRRASLRGAYVEPVSWRLLLREDGPECYLCGDAVDPSDHRYSTGGDGRRVFLAGPLFPTVDHVLALANGGAHARTNTLLAHFLCNSLKGSS